MDKNEALRVTNRLYDQLVARRKSIQTLDDAYVGKQSLKFASKEWADFHQNMYSHFSDNWVAVVADALAERVKVTGVSLGPDKEYEGAAKVLWAHWMANDLDSQSPQGWLQTIVTKRSMAIVWPNQDGDPSVTWEHPSQVFIDFDPNDQRRKRFALKVWVDDDTEFATLYTPSEVWKWRRTFLGVDVTDGYTSTGIYVGGSVASTGGAGGAWQPRQDGDDTWPIDNLFEKVPVVEFPNRPRLKSGPVSDVAGAMAMQDAINLFWAYTFGAADHASLPARVVTGQAAPKIPILDKDGQKIGEQEVPMSELQKGRILWLTGQHAKIGEWSRADLESFTKVIEIGVGHLGAQSRTPAHYFVANKGLSNINSDTLIATETPLVKKQEEFTLFQQRPLRELWELIALGMGDEALAKLARGAVTQFANGAIRSDAQRSDAMAKDRSVGYPFEYLLEKYGESQEDIGRIMEMKRKEGFDPQFQDMIERMDEPIG